MDVGRGREGGMRGRERGGGGEGDGGTHLVMDMISPRAPKEI